MDLMDDFAYYRIITIVVDCGDGGAPIKRTSVTNGFSLIVVDVLIVANNQNMSNEKTMKNIKKPMKKN
ncbi:hypothetical protein BLOT_016744 [Blomia tropicalis]|nr:hypothetical protein BLOT_016744 [Blomia tropicalis]